MGDGRCDRPLSLYSARHLDLACIAARAPVCPETPCHWRQMLDPGGLNRPSTGWHRANGEQEGFLEADG